MSHYLTCALAAVLLVGCRPDQSAATEQSASPAAETSSTTLALPAPPADRTSEYLAEPQIGDVLVVRFLPNGQPPEQFYFYRVFRVTPDSVLTNPARQPATKADADVRGMDTFAPKAVRGYTRQELKDYQKTDPADPQRSQLVQIRRGE